MPETFLIGDWRFDVAAGELHRDGRRTRLEDRASRTLALLCAHAGQPVARALIVETIWHGRLVSENSLAVVIGDLRRALGDDARAPTYIETVAKRGYRLIAPAREMIEEVRSAAPALSAANPGPSDRSRASAGVVTLLALAALALAILVAHGRRDWAPRPVPVVLGAATNDTGDRRLDPLARSLHELVRDYAAGLPGIVLTEEPPRTGPEMRMTLRLIIWNATPTLSLSVLDGNGVVTWSAMAVGRPDVIAGVTIRKIDSLRHLLDACRAKGIGVESCDGVHS